MKEKLVKKLEEKREKYNMLVGQISSLQAQINQLVEEARRLEGEMRVLEELIKEGDK